ncbi:acetate--CoA ligase family protein [Desulfurobacterium sp.]
MKFITEPEIYEILGKVGLPVVRHKVFHSVDNLDWNYFPAIVKPVVRKPIHKTEAGGVIECSDERALKEAINTLSMRFPDAECFIVEEKVEGIEAFLTLKRDSSFGFVGGFGTGGFFVEFLDDVVFLPAFATRSEIGKALKKTRLLKLIKGYRNKRGNEELFIDFVFNFLKIPGIFPEIEEIEINPLFIGGDFVLPADGKGFIGDVFEKEKEATPVPSDIFCPESVAVIGASKREGSVGYALLKNLSDFSGKVFAVNPKYSEINGKKCFPSVLSVKDNVDCAVIAVPAPLVPEVLRECGEKGVKLAVIISAGFGERGEEGKLLEKEIKDIARNYSIRILGPNTLGFIIPSIGLNASFSKVMPERGNVAFISQSGAIITAILDKALEEDFGFSSVFSLGNQVDISVTSLLQSLSDSERNRVFMVYVEEIKDGELLFSILKRRPVVFIKAGRSSEGKRATSSHTGALAGDYRVFKDVVTLKGGIVVDSVDEALECSRVLSCYGKLKGNRAVVITNAGGFGALLADYLSLYGFLLIDIEPIKKKLSSFLPKGWSRINPIDILGDATSLRYEKTFKAVENLDWDVAFVVVTPQYMTDIHFIAREIVDFQKRVAKPVFPCFIGGFSVKNGIKHVEKNGIPAFTEPLLMAKVVSFLTER